MGTSVGLRRGRGRGFDRLVLATLFAALAFLWAPSGDLGRSVARAADPDTVRILLDPASDLDPAAQGDIGSAAVSAQLFESLTAIDAGLQTRPALAESWEFRDDGATVVHHENLLVGGGSARAGNAFDGDVDLAGRAVTFGRDCRPR